jgi:ATP-dependent Clp protease adapter protein ClpS
MSQHHADQPAAGPPPQQAPARSEPRPGKLPPYRVILTKDGPCDDMMFIVRTIMELTRFCRAEATHKMWEVVHCGRSKLLVTHRERAELYVEQFASRGLVVTIEPA